MPPRPVAILHLEDSPADAKLVAATLRADQLDCEITVVDTRRTFTDALMHDKYDLIISDHSLPGFDGLEALRLARSLSPDIPFISVSGAFGEEAAVEIVKAGATDYVLKQRLFRLGSAVRRALTEADERVRRARAETEVHNLGEQLRHAQRLEAVGRLAGGLAHDFNNLLTVINGYCEQMLQRLPVHHELRPLVTSVSRAGQRGADLTKRLLAFSRRQVLAPRVVAANDIVQDVRPMLGPLLGERITLALALDPRAGLVSVDPSQIEQVLLNLASNAHDAMPTGGTLTIETHNVTITEPHGRLEPGPYVEIVVRDTGHGMDEELRAHLFEPFFTTKERGRGTGLGLATAYGIVTQSGGTIDVESAPGRGTSIAIRLPYATGEATSANVVETDDAPPPGGNETLLLVEDDESVRDLVADFLGEAGYNVLQAGDAAEAEVRCRDAQFRIHLLVSDVVLPGLDGAALSERLRRLVPGLKTLLISGYPGDAVVRPSAESGTAFLPKPFSRAVLLRKVREALG